MKEGIDGLLHDNTRPSRIPPLGPEVAARVVALTLADPPVETMATSGGKGPGYLLETSLS